MITAVSAPEPPEEPQRPKTEAEMIADYRAFRTATLTDAVTVFNHRVYRQRALTDVATTFTLPKIAVRNVLAGAVAAGGQR